MNDDLPQKTTGPAECRTKGLRRKNKKRGGAREYIKIAAGHIFTPFNALCAAAIAALVFAQAAPAQLFFALIFILNAAIGIFRGIRAKRALDKISIVTSVPCRALRGGKAVTLDKDDVAEGDVLIIEAGDSAAADCVILSGEVEADESMLTGESMPVKKAKGDALYAGAVITGGSCLARAEKVGDEVYAEELTKKAKKLRGAPSELMRSIRKIIKWITLAVIPLSAGIFFVSYSAAGAVPLFTREALFGAGRAGLNEAIRKTCAVTVGMIPAGMMLLTTVALTAGAVRLAKKGALVKDPYAVEGLARADVLCLDKTGTLTSGEMRLEEFYPLSRGKKGYFSSVNKCGDEKVISALLACFETDNATSSALKKYFSVPSALTAKEKIPFSSERKLSAATFEGIGTVVLGAPEYVFRKINEPLARDVTRLAMRGLRVMAVGYARGEILGGELPNDVRPYALIALSDELRAGAEEAIEELEKTGVIVKVISGDSPVTAADAAMRAGVKGAERYISLEGLSDGEVERAADEYTVFGRVTPEQKAVIVRALKKGGKRVAMTGDGVNDIPALKEADCAVSLESGTNAAKSVSHIILGKTGFCALPKAAAEGGRIVSNVEKTAALYLVKSALIAMLAALCVILREEYFFTTDNLLPYEILIDGAAAAAFTMQRDGGKAEGSFLKNVIGAAAPWALSIFISVAGAYFLFRIPAARAFIYGENADMAEATAVMTVILTLCGTAMLISLCRPFNAQRALLAAGITAACACFFTVRIGGFPLSALAFAEAGGLALSPAETLFALLAAAASPVTASAVSTAAGGLLRAQKKGGLMRPFSKRA